MSRVTPVLCIASVLILGLLAPPAHAQLTRTFISAEGSDVANCSRVTPCRSLQVAHDKTVAGGEINMLDPAGYGTVVITKSISIVNDGVGSAGVLVPAAGTGITISAGATDIINLRGLIIGGANVGTTGIRFNTGATLTIENCVVRNLVGTGIAFFPNAASRLAVTNTFVADAGSRGIHVLPQSGATVAVSAVIHRTEVHNGTDLGIFAQGTGSSGTIDMVVSDSVAAGNTNSGIRANSLSGATTTLTVVRSVSIGNGTGISVANGNASVRVAQSTITGNGTGWLAQSGGSFESYGDNYVNGNTAGEAAMPSIARK